MPIASNLMGNLPQEIIIEILSWMPMKPLKRFKCVSKPWCNLISNDPDFIKLQSERSNEPLLLFITNSSSSRSLKSIKLNALDQYPTEHHPLSISGIKSIRIVGSSNNGFLCLYLNRGQESNPQFVLYNPITRVEKLLSPPDGIHNPPPHIYRNYGFGYDPTTDDHKLVLIHSLRTPMPNGPLVPHVYVYSLNANKWVRTIKFPKPPCYCLYTETPCYAYLAHCFQTQGLTNFVNNAFHWVAYIAAYPNTCFEDPKSNTIACFGLSNESHYEILFPDFGWPRSKYKCFRLKLGVLDGCLHVLVEDVDLWVMKEYGVKESWTKLYTLPNMEGNVRPIAYWNLGSEILFEKRDEKGKFFCYLFSFDLKNRSIMDLGLCFNEWDRVGYYEKSST